jgi:hypothetical protein
MSLYTHLKTKSVELIFFSNLLSRIFFMKNYDLSFLDLSKPQGSNLFTFSILIFIYRLKYHFFLPHLIDEPKRDNVLYIECPSNWTTQDIFDLFSPFGQVYVGWIGDGSAFVAIQNQDYVKKAAGQLVGVSGRDYRVYFYSTYINQLSKNKNGNNSNNKSQNTTQSPNNINNNDNNKGNKNVNNNSVDKNKKKKVENDNNNSQDKRKRSDAAAVISNNNNESKAKEANGAVSEEEEKNSETESNASEANVEIKKIKKL